MRLRDEANVRPSDRSLFPAFLPQSPGERSILHLQQSIGNRAVQRLVQQRPPAHAGGSDRVHHAGEVRYADCRPVGLGGGQRARQRDRCALGHGPFRRAHLRSGSAKNRVVVGRARQAQGPHRRSEPLHAPDYEELDKLMKQAKDFWKNPPTPPANMPDPMIFQWRPLGLDGQPVAAPAELKEK
jgi:hypothetical protein